MEKLCVYQPDPNDPRNIHNALRFQAGKAATKFSKEKIINAHNELYDKLRKYEQTDTTPEEVVALRGGANNNEDLGSEAV